MVYIKTKLIKSFSVLIILALFVISVASASVNNNAPNIKLKHGTSSNWAGYAVNGTTGSVTDVKGSWIVPDVTRLNLKKDQYASFWIGIDGDISNTVEQIGTDSDIINGVPTYYAWYEIYPKPFTIIPRTIKPGDIVSAEVNYDKATNQFIVSMTVTDSTGVSQPLFSASSSSKTAKRNSAEWITESLSSLPLANFKQVYFSSCDTTMNGQQATLDLIPTAEPITMVTKSGIPKATPSAVATGGNFNVSWNSAGS